MTTEIAGYTFDTAAPSSVTEAELADLMRTVLFTEDDSLALAQAGDVLEDQVDDILDVWSGFVGANPHLLRYFSNPAGDPLPDYLARVRTRFGQWILDSCRRPYDAQGLWNACTRRGSSR